MNIKSDERRQEITLQVLFGLLHHPLHLLPTNFMVLCVSLLCHHNKSLLRQAMWKAAKKGADFMEQEN